VCLHLSVERVLPGFTRPGTFHDFREMKQGGELMFKHGRTAFLEG
jgi:hypothetical protein